MAPVLVIAAACAAPRPSGSFRSGPEDPVARTLRVLRGAQEPDGSFGGGASVPREVSTAFVLGLLSASEPPGAEVDALLAKAAAFLLSRQGEDGAFGDRLATCLCVSALASYGRRLRGEPDPGLPGLEIFDPGLFGPAGGAVDAAFRLREIRRAGLGEGPLV